MSSPPSSANQRGLMRNCERRRCSSDAAPFSKSVNGSRPVDGFGDRDAEMAPRAIARIVEFHAPDRVDHVAAAVLLRLVHLTDPLDVVREVAAQVEPVALVHGGENAAERKVPRLVDPRVQHS